RPERTFFGIVRAAWILALHSHRLNRVRIAAGEQVRPAGHTPTAEIAMLKTNARFGQPIDIRRLDPRPRLRIAADGAGILVVAEEKQDIGALLRDRAPRRGACSQAKNSYQQNVIELQP